MSIKDAVLEDAGGFQGWTGGSSNGSISSGIDIVQGGAMGFNPRKGEKLSDS